MGVLRLLKNGSKSNIGIISVPFSKGQQKLGVELGPKFIKCSGKLFDVLRENTGKFV